MEKKGPRLWFVLSVDQYSGGPMIADGPFLNKAEGLRITAELIKKELKTKCNFWDEDPLFKNAKTDGMFIEAANQYFMNQGIGQTYRWSVCGCDIPNSMTELRKRGKKRKNKKNKKKLLEEEDEENDQRKKEKVD